MMKCNLWWRELLALKLREHGAIAVLARRVAFPLLFLAAGLAVVQPCAGTGGVSPDELASAETYDPLSGTWSATGSLIAGRYSQTATLLPNGKVLVAGGAENTGGAYYALASAELYDPVSGKWSATGELGTARIWHTATLLPNGKVLVAAGSVGIDSFGSAELYDPASGSWTTTGNLATARFFHTATLLPNGKVLVAGGYTTSAELYDPASGSWMATGSLANARTGHTATLLLNGKVLVAGGDDGARTGLGRPPAASSPHVLLTGRSCCRTARLNPCGSAFGTELNEITALSGSGHTHLQDSRFRFIAILLLASSGFFCSFVA